MDKNTEQAAHTVVHGFSPLTEESKTECKLKVNEILWQYGGPTMTLQEAEALAVEFWGKVMRSWPC